MSSMRRHEDALVEAFAEYKRDWARAFYAANPDHFRAYRADNAEMLAARKAAYRSRHPEVAAALKVRNRARINEQQNARYAARREEMQARDRAYYAANRARIRERKRNKARAAVA